MLLSLSSRSTLSILVDDALCFSAMMVIFIIIMHILKQHPAIADPTQSAKNTRAKLHLVGKTTCSKSFQPEADYCVIDPDRRSG